MRKAVLTYCTNCRAEARQGAAFCPNCGAHLVAHSQQPPQFPPVQHGQGSLPAPTVAPPDARTPYPQLGPKQATPLRQGKSRTAIITTVAAITLVSILIIAAVTPSGGIFLNNTNSRGSHSIQSNAGNYTAKYSWVYMGKVWALNEIISFNSYYEYRDQPKTYNYASYVTKDDPTIVKMAEELKSDAQSSGYDTAQFILYFVQNMPYGTDENTTGSDNYPRYPVETLVDSVGDCKDHSTLYVSLMESQAIDIGMVLLELTKPGDTIGHMAAGIWGTGYTGTYIQYGGRDYYYCETTYPGWEIGQMPSELSGYDVQVLTA